MNVFVRLIAHRDKDVFNRRMEHVKIDIGQKVKKPIGAHQILSE